MDHRKPALVNGIKSDSMTFPSKDEPGGRPEGWAEADLHTISTLAARSLHSSLTTPQCRPESLLWSRAARWQFSYGRSPEITFNANPDAVVSFARLSGQSASS